MAKTKQTISTIGVLTNGGDCPGLNAVIRAVSKTAIMQYGLAVFGIEDGYLGLIQNRMRLLDASDVAEAEEAQVGERAAQTGEAGQHVGDEGEGIVGGHRVVGRGGLLQGAARICRSSFDEKQGLVAAKGMAAKKSTNIERE